MKKGIHRDMAYQTLRDYKNPQMFEFLTEGTARPDWGTDKKTKAEWLKEWMDMPDNTDHAQTKMSNDHSYKLKKDGKGNFRIVFIKNKADQGTVLARLKSAARDAHEWADESEPRSCAITIAKSIHWVIDMSSPSHTCAAWDTYMHSKMEDDFDRMWKKFYDPKKVIKKAHNDRIKDIYRWGMGFIRDRYDRNLELYQMYKSGGSIKKGKGEKLGKEVIADISQNIADYLAYVEKKIKLEKTLKEMKALNNEGRGAGLR